MLMPVALHVPSFFFFLSSFRFSDIWYAIECPLPMGLCNLHKYIIHIVPHYQFRFASSQCFTHSPRNTQHTFIFVRLCSHFNGPRQFNRVYTVCCVLSLRISFVSALAKFKIESGYAFKKNHIEIVGFFFFHSLLCLPQSIKYIYTIRFYSGRLQFAPIA